MNQNAAAITSTIASWPRLAPLWWPTMWAKVGDGGVDDADEGVEQRARPFGGRPPRKVGHPQQQRVEAERRARVPLLLRPRQPDEGGVVLHRLCVERGERDDATRHLPPRARLLGAGAAVGELLERLVGRQRGERPHDAGRGE